MEEHLVTIPAPNYEKLCQLASAVEKLLEGRVDVSRLIADASAQKTVKPIAPFPLTGWVTAKQIMAFMAIGPTKFYEFKKMPGFPKSVNFVGPADSRWKAEDIREYCDKGGAAEGEFE